jgi:hypothetical protein
MPRYVIAAALLAIAFVARAQNAAPLPAETRLVGSSGAPAATEDDFTIDTAQDLTVTLTDLQVPAALGSATVAITQGGTLVGSATLAPPATTATLNVPGAAGQFVLRVFGAPNSAYSFGTFTVCVAPQNNPSNCIQNASIAGNISAASAAADPTVSTLSVNLTVVTAGTYTVAFSDDKFPAALNVAPNLALFQGSVPVALSIPSGTTVALNPGTYTLLSIAQADQTLKAGLYGIAITGPTGVAPLLDVTLPVGQLAAAAQTTNPSAQNLTLKISDFTFPAALASASALVSAGSTSLSTVSSAGAMSSFAAAAGPLQVWSFASAGTDAGTYEVDLTSAAASLLQSPHGVSSGGSLAFGFSTPSLDAGVNYQANAADFLFPQALQGLQFAVAQGGVILKKAAAAGTLDFTPAAGPVVLLVNATTPATGNGLFDVNVQNPAAATPLIFDQTQTASLTGLFDSQTIILGTSGDFDVTLTDLDFPAQFQDLALVLSSGGTILGKTFGGGTFSIAATPGNYQLTFVATPASQQHYGLYAVKIDYSAPTVTLSAAPMSVTVGEATTLSWTTTDATSCTGSGGSWTGSAAVGSGSISVSVTATTTYTLSCMGPGGPATQSVTVTAAAAPASHSGGGGTLDFELLFILGLAWLGSVRGRRSPV